MDVGLIVMLACLGVLVILAAIGLVLVVRGGLALRRAVKAAEASLGRELELLAEKQRLATEKMDILQKRTQVAEEHSQALARPCADSRCY